MGLFWDISNAFHTVDHELPFYIFGSGRKKRNNNSFFTLATHTLLLHKVFLVKKKGNSNPGITHLSGAKTRDKIKWNDISHTRITTENCTINSVFY